MILTDHAKRRWSERFKNLNIDYEFTKSWKPKKKDARNIQKQCPEHVSMMKRKQHYGLRYRLSPNGVVFVCGPDELIITVFPYACQESTTKHVHKVMYRKGKVTKDTYIKKNWK